VVDTSAFSALEESLHGTSTSLFYVFFLHLSVAATKTKYNTLYLSVAATKSMYNTQMYHYLPGCLGFKGLRSAGLSTCARCEHRGEGRDVSSYEEEMLEAHKPEGLHRDI